MNEKLSFKTVIKKGSLIYNPVLVQLIALCPVVAASTTLKNAILLSAVLALDLIVTCVLASLFMKTLPRWVRVPLYLLIGLAVVCPVIYYFEHRALTDIGLGMRVFLPLIAVNSATAVHCEQYAVKNSVKLAVFDAAAVSIGISVIFLITGAVREVFGSGTFAGYEVNIPVTLKGAALPFGSLILLGFLAAALNAFNAKFAGGEDEEETVEEPAEETNTEIIEEPVVEKPVETAETETVAEVQEQTPPVTEKTPEEDIFGLSSDLNDFLESLGIDVNGEGGESK